MKRCAKYERIGTYERIRSPKVNPMYAILPADENVSTTLALTPILFITKNEDRVYEVDKKYHRKCWCMFDEGVRVKDEPYYLVLDGITKKEIMRVKRYRKKERDSLNEKEGEELYKYLYIYEIGSYRLELDPSLAGEEYVILQTMEVIRTDDLGNSVTGHSIDPTVPFKIWGGDNVVYMNFSADLTDKKSKCCSCCAGCDCGICCCIQFLGETYCRSCYNTTTCIAGCFADCCSGCCNCGGSGGGGGKKKASSNDNPTAEGNLDIWINAGDNVGSCCHPARRRTNTITETKRTISNVNNEQVLHLINYSRIEGKMDQDFYSNSTLVEVVKSVTKFEEMIALIFTQLHSIMEEDQYDIDKELPEKSPCCCID